jgi:hypothetical protein
LVARGEGCAGWRKREGVRMIRIEYESFLMWVLKEMIYGKVKKK